MHAKRPRLTLWLTAVVLAAALRPAAAAFTARDSQSSVLLPTGDTLVIGGYISGAATNSVQRILRGSTGQVNNETTLPQVAVGSATATLLPNGQVLVAGGANAGVAQDWLQVYDPVAQTWHSLHMSVARKNHTATLLKDGRVLICGGENATPAYNTTCDLYCPASGASTSVCSGEGTTSISMLDSNGRTLHTAVRLSDGRVLISGGYNSTAGYLLTQEVFTPGTTVGGGSFGAAHALINSRAYHRASMLGNGKVLIVGGFNGKNSNSNQGYLNSVEVYDPVSDTVSPAAGLTDPVAHQAQYVEPDGDVLIAGGLGNVTTAYQSLSGSEIVATPPSVISGNGATPGWPEVDFLSSGQTFSLTLQNVSIGDPNASGQIINGAILLSTITFPSLVSSVDIIAPDGSETSPGVYSGTYIDLKNTIIYSTAPGTVSGTFPVTFGSGGGLFFRPLVNKQISNNPKATAGSHIHFNDNGGAGISSSDGSASVTTAGSSLIMAQFDVSGLPSQLIGANVSGEMDITTLAVSSSGVATFDLDGGKLTFTGLAVTRDTSNGSGKFTVPNGATFTNLTGTVVPQCSTANCLTDANFNAGNGGLSGQGVSATVNIDYTADKITFDGSESFNTGLSTIVVRAMDFGQILKFSPSANTWSLDSRFRNGVQNMEALVQPDGSARLIGGLTCGTSCSDDTYTGIIPQLESTQSGANLNQARGNHTTTVLPDGTLLVAGGSNGSNVLRTAELFDPKTRTFKTTGSMYEARDLHTATLLPNGNVLVVGGFTTNALSTGSTSGAEIYYPKSHAWRPTSPLITTGGTLNPVTAHTATLLADGSVLVTGGYQSGQNGIQYLDTAAIYYSTSATWSPITSMMGGGSQWKRAFQTATLLQDGRVLFIGGINQNGLLSAGNGAFGVIYDPKGPTDGAGSYWYTIAAPPIGTGLENHSAVLLPDGNVLVAGGNDGFGETNTSMIYTPSGVGNGCGSWTATVTNLNISRLNGTVTALPNGTVAALGGATALGNSINSVETFSVWASSWQINQNTLKSNRANHTATVGLDGNIYVIGGFDGTQMLKSTEFAYFGGSPDSDTPNASNPTVRKSSITSIDNMPFDNTGQNITLGGKRLQGAGESSGGAGGSGSASNDAPRLILQALDPSGGAGSQGGSGMLLDLTSQIYNRSSDPNHFGTLDTSMTVTLPGNVYSPGTTGNLLPYGWYAARAGVNGIYADGLAVQAGPRNIAGPPGAVSANVLGTSSITWSWTASTGTFDGYALYSSSSGIFIGTAPASGPYGGQWSCNGALSSNPCFVQTQLSPNTTGAIMVAAYNLSEDGPLTFSNTSYTLPSAPQTLAISSVSFNSLQLTWDPNDNAPGTIYEVSQSSDNFQTDFSTPVPLLSNLTSTSTTISPLSLNTTYYFRVRAYNGVDVPSDFSNVVSTRTRAPVFGLTGTPIAGDPTQIEWTWQDPGGTIGFNIYNSTTGKVIGTTDCNANPPPSCDRFFDTGLSTNTRRSVMVSALTSSNNTILEGPLSQGASVFTLAAPPLPANPAVSNISTNSFVGSWQPNGNPIGTQYTMQVLDDAGVLLASATTTSSFNGAFSGFSHTSQPFTARVVATNGDGVNTTPVVLGSSSTLAMAPLGLFVTATTPSSISVSWSNQNNGSTTTYQVTYTSDAFQDTHILFSFAQKINTTSATITGLLTSTTYQIQVVAANEFGAQSAPSNAITTAPFNGGVSLGQLGVQVDHLQTTLLQGSVAGGRQVSLFVPSNSFTNDTFLTLSTFTPTVPCSGGTPITLQIDPSPALEPLTPLTLTLGYSASELTNPSQATLMRITDTGECVPVKTVVDTKTQILTAQLNHISQYQVAQVAGATSADTTFVFPNPLYLSRGQGYFTFSQMPAGSRVRVFTMRGEVLADMTANDSGIATWAAVNKQNRIVASGVYLVAVEAPNKSKKILKVVVLR